MKIFNSVAQMKLATIKAGQYVETFGYYTKGDGGQARYLVVASQAADGYGDHVLANGTVAVLQVDYSITVEKFGAATSIVDNSGAINAALESAATVISSLTELQIQATVVIPSGKQCDGLKLFADGDTFTTYVMPVCLVVNKTFGTLATADRDIHFVNGSIRVSNNTATVNPKLIMFGGVKNGWIKNNVFTADGAKHSAAIECYKSTENIWIEDNSITITTGDVTGGGIWLANRTSTEVSHNIHVNRNTIKQDSIDEIIAVFPVAGPMQNIRINDNFLTRLNSGATDGVGLRIFCADGLGGGAATATLKNVKGRGNTIAQLKTDNVTSGVMQIGNASIDANDPEDVVFTDTTLTGYFSATTIGVRFDFNAKAKNVGINNTMVVASGALSGSSQGISDPSGEVFIDGGYVENFGTNITGFEVRNMEVVGGSFGIKVIKNAVGNTCRGMPIPIQVNGNGAGVSQLVKSNTLIPSAGRCLRIDASSNTVENLRIVDNDFDGSVGSIKAIEKLGSNTVTNTYTSGNDFSTITVANLWNSTLGMVLDRNIYIPSLATPVGNLNADVGSVFWSPVGGGGATLFVKATLTGTGVWVAK